MTKYFDDYEMAERHFSDPRLRLYLRQANGDRAAAVRLYIWNARLSASLLTDIGHLEVALRNAIDSRMQLRHQSLNRPGDWLDDPTGELGRDRFGVGKHAQPYADIATAKRRVSENKKQLSHAQIISETPFGLWHQLVSKRWTSLWPDLAAAFPNATNRKRETISDPVTDIRNLRNRIGHHHRVWSLPYAKRHAQLLQVAEFIDTDLRNWIEFNSAVPDLIANYPLSKT